MKLTESEKKAISALRKLEKQWPKSLWIFATGNSLNVMRSNADGSRGMYDETQGSAYSQRDEHLIESIQIPNDGGDF